MTNYRNVREKWLLYDTVGIFDTPQGVNIPTPAGWFTTLAGLGGVSELDFFNVRSENIGPAYNNQDARDQMPYAMRVHDIGVTLFAHSITQATAWDHTPESDFTPEDFTNHIFTIDLARHMGGILRVQQDDRLKINAMMCPSGYGPAGDGFGRGSPYSWGELTSPQCDHTASAMTQGAPYLANRWPFPKPLDIPRRGTLNFKLKLNEYVRGLLAAMPDENIYFGVDDVDQIVEKKVFFGIQVSLGGYRLIQQRAEYHA